MMAKRLALLLLFAFGLIVSYSCKPRDEIFEPNPGQGVVFSVDTVSFDTIITTLRSATLRFRIYNPNNRAVRLDEVSINPSSPFTLVVNGRPGNNIGNVNINGGDSILVLVEANLDRVNSPLPVWVQDSVMVRVAGRNQAQFVQVEAAGQNAHFYRDSILPCNTVWADKQQPYFLRDNVLVPKGCTLTIREGVKVLNFRFSNILVQGTLLVQGTREEPVIFQGTRLEQRFDNQPDQWGAIAFLDSSEGSFINYAEIKNGTHGVQVGTPPDVQPPDLFIANTRISSMSGIGIFGFGGTIEGYNNLVFDCALHNLAIFRGGRYDFAHNTFAYSNTLGFIRRDPSVVFSEVYNEPGQSFPSQPLVLNFINNIVTGNRPEEWALILTDTTNSPRVAVFGNSVRSEQTFWDANNERYAGEVPLTGRQMRRFGIPAEGKPRNTGAKLSDLYEANPPLLNFLSRDLARITRVVTDSTDPGCFVFQPD